MIRVREAPGGLSAKGGSPPRAWHAAPVPVPVRPVDVLVLCELVVMEDRGQDWRYVDLVKNLGVSYGASHESVMRCVQAQLLAPSARVARPRALDFLTRAVPVVFYPCRGGLAEGIPTSVHAPALQGKFVVGVNAMPKVWQCPVTDLSIVRGESLSPIYPTVPEACLREPALYEILALVDVVRVGIDRDREVAIELLTERLGTNRK